MTLGPAFDLFACFVGDILTSSESDGIGTDKLEEFAVKFDWLVNVVTQNFISSQQFLPTNRLSSPDKIRKILMCQLILLVVKSMILCEILNHKIETFFQEKRQKKEQVLVGRLFFTLPFTA